VTEALSGPVRPPVSGGAPKQAVVLLHGYGADGEDLIGLAPGWAHLLPEALFVSPNAPEPCALGFGYQWFPLDPERPAARPEGIARARLALSGFLDTLWQRTGLAPAATILAGFSQGAMMALDVGLALPEAPLGLIGFSGALIDPGVLRAERPRPPVCLVHGTADSVVPVRASEDAAAALEAAGCAVSLHLSPGLGHGIGPDGLDFAARFLASLVAMR
jgi:phospholipase/carboxylesterase